MTVQKTRRIIIASAMAAAVGIGVVTFAVRSHLVASVAEGPVPPPPVASIAAAPDAAAPIAAAAVATTQTPENPAAVADNDSVGSKSGDATPSSAVEHELAQERHLAKAGTAAVTTDGAATRTGPAAATSVERAPETVEMRVERLTSADQLMPPPAISSPPADDRNVAASTELGASDSQITTNVKSAIAGDSLSRSFKIGVTTTHGVVSLTGSLASQDAIDQVKTVAGNVKDVRSVDTSALILARL